MLIRNLPTLEVQYYNYKSLLSVETFYAMIFICIIIGLEIVKIVWVLRVATDAHLWYNTSVLSVAGIQCPASMNFTIHAPHAIHSHRQTNTPIFLLA